MRRETQRRKEAISNSKLRRLARQAGIETSYRDYCGKECEVSEETLGAILQFLPQEDRGRAPNYLPPVLAAWNGRLPRINPRKSASQKIRLRLELEDGQQAETKLLSSDTFSHTLSNSFRDLVPEEKLPFGYHQLELETPKTTFRSLLISAPKRSYSAAESRRRNAGATPALPGAWGAFMPLYALHSARSWGSGNFSDLSELGRSVAGQGASVLATLPLLSGFFTGNFKDPSPYSPVSRLFWNEFYIDIENLPEFASCKAAQKKFGSTGFQKRLRAARQAQWVDYSVGMQLRREALELLAVAAKPNRLEQFVRERPIVRDYARFRAVCDRLDLPWQKWPERLRAGKIETGDFAARDERYYLYAQWAARRQVEKMTGTLHDAGVRLYLDLPLGVNRYGFDVWRNQDLFVSEVNAGAPPDMFFSKGQNWGFPPMNPGTLRRTGYRHVIEYLRFQMRHAAMLRIDHVMGLHRLYWIPPGFSPRDGAYVRYPADELHAIICLESHRRQCEIVGENLGIVPQEVNQAMDIHRYRKMYVVQFEQRAGRLPLKSRPENCIAMLDTHDTPMFTAFWRGLDIPLRMQLGLLGRKEAKTERAKRKKLNLETARFLVRSGFLKTEKASVREVMQALIAWLRKSEAGVTLISLEDLWRETRPQNIPGIWREYKNWRRKAALSLQELRRLEVEFWPSGRGLPHSKT